MKAITKQLLSQNTYSILITVLLVSIPLPYAFSSIALIALVGVSFFSAFYHKLDFKIGYTIPLALYVLMIISLLWTVELGKSLRGLERQLPFLILPLAFWMMPRLSKQVWVQILYRFSMALTVLASLFLLRACYRYLTGDSLDVFLYHDLVSVFELNAIYISVMVSLSLLFVFFYSKKSVFNICAGLVLAIFLVLLASKNIIITTMICFLIGAFISRGKIFKKKRYFLVVFFSLFLGVLMFSPLKQRINEELTSNIKEVLTCELFNKTYPWTGTTLRIFQARVAYELLEENENYLTGFGINASQEKIVERQKHYNLYWGYYVYNFHNQYIQTYLEIGVFGFIGILFLLVFIFKKYLTSKELFFLFFFVVMSSVFLSETYIWRQRGMIYFLVLFMLMCKIDLQASVKKES